MMLLYSLTALQRGLLDGFPVTYGWVVNDHIVYAVLLFGLGAFGAGRILGLDAIIERSKIARENQFLRYLLG
jgi:thiosulfate dehydrogenase (quinone) large subunit